jgi:hypothetical protein
MPHLAAWRHERDGLSAARRERSKGRAVMGAELGEVEAKLGASERERATLAKTLAGSVVIVGLACYAVIGGKPWLCR